MSKSQHKKPMELLNEGGVKICAPMVRYSKLPFRTLVRQYDCDLAFTPMIVANSFVTSSKARENEFKTNENDRPLITQFAASNAEDFANATELVARFCDGVDLNCGCPQRWAIQDGYGVHLLDNPEMVSDMMKQTRNRLNDDEFTISVKIRIHNDLERTIELCRRAEMTGVSFITVHGRTKDQRKEPVNLDAVRIISDSVRCPVVVNGDVKTMDDFKSVQDETGAKGVMVGRGLLCNPALFAGYDTTPIDCIQRWLNISLSLDISFTLFHQQLMYMCEKLLPRSERRIFNLLNDVDSVLVYFNERYGIYPDLNDFKITLTDMTDDYNKVNFYRKSNMVQKQQDETVAKDCYVMSLSHLFID